MDVGFRAALTETAPKEWMASTPATEYNAVDVMEFLQPGSYACADYSGPVSQLRVKAPECARVQAYMTLGYRAVIDELTNEWMVETAINFANAIDVMEELQPGNWACSDYSMPVPQLKKKAPECLRVQAWMAVGDQAVIDDLTKEWMHKTAINFANTVDVVEDLMVGSWACSDYSGTVPVLRKKAPECYRVQAWMAVGNRASFTEVEPKEWMVATEATLANALDVVEELHVGNIACSNYDGPTPFLKKMPQVAYRV
jgi:hypothetical protein